MRYSFCIIPTNELLNQLVWRLESINRFKQVIQLAISPLMNYGN